MNKNSLQKQFVMFSGVGAVGTAAHYATLVALVDAIGLSPVLSSTVAFCIGAAINYSLNYRFTFVSKKRHSEAASKFFLVALTGATINGGIMSLGTAVLEIHYLMAQIVATGVVLLFNFSANRAWTFAVRSHDP